MLRLKYLYKQSCSWQNLEFLRNTRSHPSIIKNVFHTKKITRIEQENWYTEDYCTDPNYMIWLVYDENKQVPIAYIQYHIESLIHRRCNVGYVISPEFSCISNVYDKKIINMMIKNVKGWKDEIHRLETKILTSDNVRLKKLTQCGFEIDSLIRDYIYKDGEYRDIYLLSYLIGV